jgi:outer membrane protein assembly factor BamE (lipoprotein component of BamABCDE complex)
MNSPMRPRGATIASRPRHLQRTLWLGLALSGSLLAGCVYRMPIQQGNHLDEATVSQVVPGMTRVQVRYLLGTPMVPGGFVNDRWDYDYYLKMRRLTEPLSAHATVYFNKSNLVDHVVSDVRGNAAVPLSKRNVNAPGA